MIAPITRQVGLTRLELIIAALIVLIGGGVVVALAMDSNQKIRYMETTSVPLIEALDRYRAQNKSYPDKLEKLVPAYMQELPGCNSQKKRMAYTVDKDSGEYFLNCGLGMFNKRQYSSKTKGWETWD